MLCSCKGQTKSTAKKEKGDDTSASTLEYPVATNQGIIFFSSDNGLSWKNMSDGLPDTAELGLGAIAVSHEDLGVVTREHGVYIFDVQQDLWVSIPSDQRIIESNPGALTFYNGQIYVGTQLDGVFYLAKQGKSWTNIKTGLDNLTIRKLVQLDGKLYAGTNAGIYSFNEFQNTWELEYSNPTLQVNGITAFAGSIYIGTNQGVFTSPKGQRNWINLLNNRSVHNISSDDETIYAMVYNELLSSTDEGQSWQNIQKGLPAQLYTFNVIKQGNSVFAGQWDGVYRKDNAHGAWKSYSEGLPEKFALTNMTSYMEMIIVSGNERRLSPGISTNK
ncbi:hypothetical protein [Catalinimonas alkaloidigena]|uniref:hypothetical protein n=1 Tax=Catalinimonas alkaloidigena TaxID=1075417 RepID=UPI002405466F|nr:hypothetical protein [Catalinimonas alkaloidigena]